jgi:exodeoxyribonuclease VIII
MSFADYCSEPGLNISTLEHGSFSAEHLRAALDGRMRRDSPSMNIGRAIHARLLEPDVYKKEFHIASPCGAKLSSGARKGQECGKAGIYITDDGWRCGTHCIHKVGEKPTNVISESEAATVEDIAAKIGQHKVVRLLRQRGGCEATIVWDMEGERCRGRLDKYIPRNEQLPPVIIDLKKCRLGHARTDLFEKAIVDYNYDMKAAWYVDGVTALTNDQPVFIWIAVEDTYPYGINVIQADKETILVGRLRYRELLGTYLRAKALNQWDGYTKEIVTGGLPAWMKIRYLGSLT